MSLREQPKLKSGIALLSRSRLIESES
eukprot:SAG11_NODE_17233_length_524_cov_1.287059_1_plen_26_part_10